MFKIRFCDLLHKHKADSQNTAILEKGREGFHHQMAAFG